MIADSPEYRLFLKAYSERKAPLTVFVGSGLSSPAGLPTWSSLKSKLMNDVKQRVSQNNKFGEAFNRRHYETLKSTTDPWLAFKLIKEILGEPTFNGLIEFYLSPSDSIETPPGYGKILSLEPQGLVTLNLDRFAGDAVEAAGQRFSPPIYGRELPKKWNILLENRPHLVYLHGDVLNPATWVLTHDDLDELKNSPAHAVFLQEKYLKGLILFVGISADDQAISSRLLELTGGGLRPKNLFWLTSRRDEGLRAWANDQHVKLIRYTAPSNDDHFEAISTLVDAALTHDPVEPAIDLIANPKYVVESIPEPFELAKLDPESIRKNISSGVEKLISQYDGDDLYINYRDFCKRYHFAIHHAFYKNRDDGFDKWFGYQLSFPSVGKGNFGEVYSAISPDGELCAVKIMNETAFSSDEMLGGFRRGARSMRLIQDRIPGMVSLIEAFELPPTIVMPFIPGVSLQDALDQHADMSWAVKLKIGERIAKTVSEAHALESTVLHRDLKPSNVMIENFEYNSEFDPNVIVLDFDMSWHKGAKEKDVVFESRDDFGFLCPEQTDPDSPYHARTTKVDSYGLGMTLFYMYSGRQPLANEPMSSLWPDSVIKVVSRGYNLDWKSAPIRLARAIIGATKFDQLERSDFFKLRSQLEVIAIAIQDPGKLDDLEVWAEELLANIRSSIPYEWDESNSSGSIRSPSGVEVTLCPNPTDRILDMRIVFQSSGAQRRSTVPQLLRQTLDVATRKLKEGGWKSVTGNVAMQGLSMNAQTTLSDLKSNRNLAGACSEVYRLFQA
jgi:eukaryotic-like serine/threonine-protein kinase